MPESIRRQLLDILKERGLTVAAAESCTGGLIASAFVDIPGSSAVLKASLVTYMEEMKVRLLGVNEDTISRYTVVSPQVAEEMCINAPRLTGADIGLSSTGYAGPEGGTAENPVGTVYIGISYRGRAHTYRLELKGDRNEIRTQAVEEVLKRLLALLTNNFTEDK